MEFFGTERSIYSDNPANALQGAIEKIEKSRDSEKPELRENFLDYINGVFNRENPVTQSWLRAIISFSPYFIKAHDETFDFIFSRNNLDRLRSIVTSALKSVDENERTEIVLRTIGDVFDISVLCDAIRTIIPDSHPKGGKHSVPDAWFGDQNEVVRNALVDKIREQVSASSIWGNAAVDRVLWFWWGANCEQEVREFADRQMDDPFGLSQLLQVTISHGLSSSDGRYEHVSEGSWSNLLDVHRLESCARQLIEKNPEDSVARRFLKALEQDRAQRRN